ncbi:hypothetical protein RugamoR1_41960 [Rugamonas sp. R1(2021)]
MSAMTACADAALPLLPAGIPGHTYDATANCIYSMLSIATMAVRKREKREVFIDEKALFG